MLNPLEKILLSLASVVLSNRYMRNLFVLYAMGLHFIVLATLYSDLGSGAVNLRMGNSRPIAIPPM